MRIRGDGGTDPESLTVPRPMYTTMEETYESQDGDRPFHEGEVSVQKRAGVRETSERVADIIRSEASENSHPFVSDQRFVAVGSADQDGNLWATLLFGEPGFVEPKGDVFVIGSSPTTTDPLHANLDEGGWIGTLLIDPGDRKRLRVNGKVSEASDGRVVVDVAEAYPNCHKYIQNRSLEETEDPDEDGNEPETTTTLSQGQTERIESADTFFIASLHPDRGADVSHRGGDPGFVEVTDGNRIEFPDYEGNKMFNTLGNLRLNPNAGLVFPDFDDGRMLHLTGEAEVVWEGDKLEKHEGAERVVVFDIDKVVDRPNGNPLRWRLEQRSRFNP